MRSLADLLPVLLICVLAACGEKDSPDDSTGASDSDAVYGLETCDAYTWETAGAPFVYTWCTACHSSYLEGYEERQCAPSGLNLDSLESVCGCLSWVGAVAIYDLEAETPGLIMPPTGGPTAEEMTAFQTWIDCGPPECDGIAFDCPTDYYSECAR